jgi:hypothetical protein
VNCPQCQYDRTGLDETHACPECGLTLRADAVVFEGWSDAAPPNVWAFIFMFSLGVLATSHTYNAIKGGFLWPAVGGTVWAFFMWLFVYRWVRKFIRARERDGDVRLLLDGRGVRAFGDATFEHPWSRLRPPKSKVTKHGLRVALKVRRGAAFALLVRGERDASEHNAAAIEAMYSAATAP